MLQVILSLNPVYVTLFWAVVLNFYPSRTHPPKVFLGKFMLVCFILYLSHFFYFTSQWDVYYYFDSFYMWASLLVYPLYHIYVRLLTKERKFSLSQHGKYVALPTLIFLLYGSGVLLTSSEVHNRFLQQTISTTLLQSPDTSGIHLYLLWVYRAARVVFVLQVFYFLYNNFRLIRQNSRQLQDYYSNTEDRKLRWVQFFNVSLAVTSLASISAAITGREAFASGEFSLAGPSVIFSTMLFFIGLLGNTQNPVRIETESPNNPEMEKERLPDQKLKRELESLFEQEKIFKNADLKIWEVSQMLGTNRTYVSRFINSEYNRNFCNHVNYYRIQYVKKLMKENHSFTNQQLAEMSGFGSLNSFYRAFQNLQGESFSQYRKKLAP